MQKVMIGGALLTGTLLAGACLAIWGNRVLPGWVAAGLAGLAVVVGVLSTVRLGGKDRWIEVAAKWVDERLSANPMLAGGVTLLLFVVAIASLLDLKRRSDAEQATPNLVVQLHERRRPVSDAEISVKQIGAVAGTDRTVATADSDGIAKLRLAIGEPSLVSVVRTLQGERLRAILPPPLVGRPEMQSVDYDLHLIEKDQWTRPDQEARVAFVPLAPRTPASRSPDPALGAAVAAHAPWGLPEAERVLARRFSTLGYDLRRRGPAWVAFKVDEQQAGPQAARRGPDRWRLDPDLPEEVQPRVSDFVGSGYDRGSLVRRTDARLAGPDGMAESFLLSNVVPQTPVSNRVTWLAVENYTTQASATGGPLYVVAGPVFPRSQSKPASVLVIGEGAVPVPTHLFRVLARERSGRVEAQAFFVPNDQTEQRDPMVFVTSPERIEEVTGLRFFPQMPEQQAAELKRSLDRSRWAP